MTSHAGALADHYLAAVPFAQVTMAAGSITGNYQAIGGTNFLVPMVIIIIVSTLDDTVQFSWDGIVDAFPILAGSAVIIDMKSDKIPLGASYGPYVKTLGAPATGSIYVGGFTV